MSDPSQLDLYLGMAQHRPFPNNSALSQWHHIYPMMNGEGWNLLCAELVRIGNNAAEGVLTCEMEDPSRHPFLRGELSAVKKVFGFLRSVQENAKMEQEENKRVNQKRV